MSTVAAVVVTYNRKAKLPKVLDHVLAQTRKADWLVIVDNASTDGTDEVLKQYEGVENVEIIRLTENTGGAGGFATGMNRGYELGADFVWIMDDDCYANSDALEELLNGLAKAEAELNMQLPFACSLVKWVDGSICEMNNPVTTWDWGRLISKGQENVLVKHCSFVSVMFPRWALTKHGLPLREYFIWFDDQEYTLRVNKSGPGVQVLSSVVVHDLGVNRGVNFSDVNASNMWKFEYGARNEASYRLHHENPVAFAKFVGRVHQGLKQGRVPMGLRVKLFKKIVEGVKFNPKPEMPRSVL
ncbi:Glycosyltransferase, GT2 family [Actinosynnema pretiosum]|uniref:Glycosyl transferase family 2 n=2 Tax=Actinosynnema TaxID=40566 RepID=C6WDV3_ACTMD|nr:glycosyltransferase family 2 protein [Actinosynnema pretiosum]ACU34098.1 glycosyl transferase family 2 [Actinosynnema mirum DSM 43827]AXX27495.1 Glycosyltransferase [Actinosynnema pretiosum subsp. pretiosum]MCP2093375.1 Glycosyltransferase, GT2 family [Actinosynnema pretiosum]QUF01791.1 glycosyltransferase family 2 protein [Actinosynnema pretiosum subsp. pretiosum]